MPDVQVIMHEATERIGYALSMTLFMIRVAPFVSLCALAAVLSFVGLWMHYGPQRSTSSKVDAGYHIWLQQRAAEMENCLRLYSNPDYSDDGKAARAVLSGD